MASSASEERPLLLWRLFFRPNVNELLRFQRRFLGWGELLVLDDAVYRVSSELTLFLRLNRLGVYDRSRAERGGDVDGGSGGSGRLRLVAEFVRLISILNNIEYQREVDDSVATVSEMAVGGCRKQRKVDAGRAQIYGVSEIGLPYYSRCRYRREAATSEQCRHTTGAVNLSQSKAANAVRVATILGVLCFRTKGTRLSADVAPRERRVVLNMESKRRQHGSNAMVFVS